MDEETKLLAEMASRIFAAFSMSNSYGIYRERAVQSVSDAFEILELAKKRVKQDIKKKRK